jgi:nicotinamidase-related amidase
VTPPTEPPRSALLILHYQNGLVRHDGIFAFSGTPVQIEKHGTLARTAAALDASRRAGIPVFYVNIEYRPGFPELRKPTYPLIESIQERNAFLRGSWDAAVPEEIEPRVGDIIVVNFDSSAFSATDLDRMLRAMDVRRLVIAGIATNWVVEGTTRQGAELGYDVTILRDCCQGFTDELHDFAIANTLPYFATISTSEEFIASLG